MDYFSLIVGFGGGHNLVVVTHVFVAGQLHLASGQVTAGEAEKVSSA